MAIGKSHFKDRLGVLGIHLGPRRRCLGWEHWVCLCSFLLFPLLPAGWLRHLLIPVVSSERAHQGLQWADKLLQPLTSRAEMLLCAWIPVEGLLLLTLSQALTPRGCPVVTASPGKGGRGCKQGTARAQGGVPLAPGSCELQPGPQGMAGIALQGWELPEWVHSPWVQRLERVGNPSVGEQAGRGMLILQPVRIPLKCKERPPELLYGSWSLIPGCWVCQWGCTVGVCALTQPFPCTDVFWMLTPPQASLPCSCHCQGLTWACNSDNLLQHTSYSE